MDDRKLPPITTHFAEYFPNHKANTAPVTPPGQFPVLSPSLKRKRSDPTDVSGESTYRPAKQLYSTSSSSWPESARSYLSGSSSAYDLPKDFRPRADSLRESGTSNHSYQRGNYSPPRSKNAGYRSEPVPGEPRRPTSASAVSGSGLGNRVNYSHVNDSSTLQPRLLPPITGFDPSVSSTKADTWKSSWQQESRPYLPPVIEPRTQYHPINREVSGRPEPHQEQRGVKRERSPNLDRPFNDVKTPRRQLHENRYQSEVSPYRRIPDPVSPVDVHEKPRTVHRMQPMQTQSTGWDPGRSSQHTSPSDPSPTSAHAPVETSTRYSWDPSSLYDNMRSVRKRRGNLPKESTALLNEWYNQHASYPYPKEAEKQELQARTGLAMSQISNWFINARRRRRPSASSRTAEGLPRTLAFEFSARND